MKSIRNSLLAIAAATGLVLSMAAQQTNQQENQGMQGMKGMQMGKGQKSSNSQMMQDCHKTMQSMMDSNAQTTKDIEAAKQSNDPAKMRTALDEAQKALTGMNDRMRKCMDMMGGMQNMHGMESMMSGRPNQEKQQVTPPRQ